MKVLLATFLALCYFTVSTVSCIKASVKPYEFAQTFQFTLNLKNVRANSFEYITPNIELEGLSSTFAFRHRSINPNVSVTLVPICNFSEPIYIQASLKLLKVPSKEDVPSKSFTLSKHLVERRRCLPAVVGVLNYFDLQSNYTQNGNVTFEIEIAANRVHPNLRPKTFGVVGRKLLVELGNVHLSSPNMNRIVAPIFTVRDINWTLFAEKKNNSLGIFLKANEYDLNTWYYKVDATITLLSFAKGVDPIKYTFTHTYSVASSIHGNDQLISLTDLLDTNKLYVFKNKLNILVEVRVE